MSKNKNEVNGVLVYRRWCAGAVISAILLLLVVAIPAAFVAYKWLFIKVPGDSSVTAAGETPIVGLDLIKLILKKDVAFKAPISDIASATTMPYFAMIMNISWYVMLGFMALLLLFAVIEAIFCFFYIVTGRVVNTAAPVKLAWVIFAFSIVYTLLSIGLGILIGNGYALAAGEKFNIASFFLASLPFADASKIFHVNFTWCVYYVLAALVVGILLSIVYSAAFKDKFFIGRAKRFGSGEQNNTPTYGTTNIITNGGTTSTNNPNGQPQVIVVNSTPAQGMPAPYPYPYVVTQPQPLPAPAPVPAPQAQEPAPAKPVTEIPQDVRSIGGHAYSKNLDLKVADIPAGIKELGVGAFANCLNLEMVSLPKSIKRIRKNCFFNCVKLTRINYAGSKAEWRYVVRGSNWLDKAGTKTVVCSDGAIIVNPHR